jgi:excinuclease UvrABC ATPase subunit
LAYELSSKGEIFVFDEPSSGLHFSDVEKLIKILNKLVDSGNKVVVIEHNVDIIKQSD